MIEPVVTPQLGCVIVTVGAAVVGQQTFVSKGSETVKQPVKAEIFVPTVKVGIGNIVLSYVTAYIT